ncbi:glycerophosphodiester phosphodiesterase family protein [Flavisphingomonas formosensis]|uniref:glycerophosphodiester phosphodiesterase family protein n=1 Tax=Flavisphingomonas formosensis TaxID=861534 RepID=UPI0012FA861E|nr:glycerophosphodiester phosphodiesterase family protein [Sphingomonas formosensis]
MRSSPFARLDAFFAPAPQRRRVAFLTAQPFAHRGLHGAGRIENSRAAFSAAVAAGHGIELDVQASRDGEPFVFHDEELDRLTDESGPLARRPGSILAAIPLAGSAETLPRLDEILALVAGRVPILIEIKTRETNAGALCLAVRRALEGYRGDVAVMSFNPDVSRWFADHAARIARGLVVTEQEAHGLAGRLRRRAALWRAKPDFLAYDVRDLPSRFAATARDRGLPLLTWTVRDAATEATGLAHADEIIYERPEAG